MPHLVANSYTPFTHYAEVVITDKERIIFTHREIPGEVFGHFLDADVVDSILQLAATVLGAENTSLGNIHVTQTDIERSAAFPPVTDQARMRVPDENTLESFPAKFLYLRSIGFYRHALRNLSIARQSHLTVYFDQTKLACHIRHNLRQGCNPPVMAKAGNIYPGLLACIQYSPVSFYRKLFTVYYNPGCCHPFFSLSNG